VWVCVCVCQCVCICWFIICVCIYLNAGIWNLQVLCNTAFPRQQWLRERASML